MAGEHVLVALMPPIAMNERLLTTKWLARLKSNDLGTSRALSYRHRIAKTDLGDIAALADVGWRGPLCFAADVLILDKAAVPEARVVYAGLLATRTDLVARVVKMHGDAPKSLDKLLADPKKLVDPRVATTPARVLLQVFSLIAAMLETAGAEAGGLIVLHVDPER